MFIIDFPELRQIYNYDCGASALQSILVYYGYEKREDKLLKQLKAEHTDIFDNGVRIKDIVKVAEGYDLDCEVKRGLKPVDLLKYIDKKIPIIVLLQAWRDSKSPKGWKNDYVDGHYVIAIGYDKQSIIFEDPSSYNRTQLSFEELEERWHAVDDDNKKDPISVAIIVKGQIKYKSNLITHMN